MPVEIKLSVQGVELRGQFNDTPLGRALAALLPLEWRASRWGEEYYGGLDRRPDQSQEGDQTLMAVGDLAYHGPSGWFCLFFGPTPASGGEEPMAALEVVKVGSVHGDWAAISALGGEVTGRVQAA